MKHICKIVNPYDEEDVHVQQYVTSDSDEDWAITLGVEGIEKELFDHCKTNMIGHLVPTTGQLAYYTPRFEKGELSLSIQLNYYLWSKRTDDREDLSTPMTEAEFEDLSGGWYDFCMEVGNRRLVNPTQMNIPRIAKMVYEFFTEEEWEAEQY